MKRHLFYKCIVLIIVLLTAQIGNAFVGVPNMQDCGMDISSSLHKSPHTMMSESLQADTLSHKMSHKMSASEEMSDTMDCCDMEASIACCGADCQCSSVVSANVVIHDNQACKTYKSSTSALNKRSLEPLDPFLHQPKRPPIYNFS